ncbi:RICIN domain-containing protein [Streptomyces sp. NPDC055663]
MRAAADGRCVAERRDGNPETGEPGLFLISCTTRESDRVTLEETGNGTYQLIFPRAKGESPGCLGVLGASLQDGGAVTIDPCGSRELNEAEEFRLEKTSDHGGGFRLRSDHLRFVPVDRRQDLCIGAPDGDHTEWANVFQLACNEGGTVFRFLR